MKIANKLCTTLLLTVAVLTQADTLELKSGKVLDGSFISREGDTINFETGGIAMSFNAADVKAISMAESAKSESAAAQTASANQSGSAEMPAGSVMTIRLNETLDTGKHATGHKFTAVMEGALVHNGVTIVPQGSRIYGVISEAKKAGRIAGNAKMMLTLTDININGQIIPVTTSAIDAYTQATAKSSGGKVVRGAAIGGLVNGSSGAKNGAKVGVAGALLTDGNQVVIPTGTLLDFKLAHSLKSNG